MKGSVRVTPPRLGILTQDHKVERFETKVVRRLGSHVRRGPPDVQSYRGRAGDASGSWSQEEGEVPSLRRFPPSVRIFRRMICFCNNMGRGSCVSGRMTGK